MPVVSKPFLSLYLLLAVAGLPVRLPKDMLNLRQECQSKNFVAPFTSKFEEHSFNNKRLSKILRLTATDATSLSVNPEERHWKKQLLRRHKYALVIGSVIVVYLLYLVTYTSMQVLHHIRLTYLKSDPKKLLLRLTMRLLFGLHAVLQPLCYLRMREFRTLIKRSVVKSWLLKELLDCMNKCCKRCGREHSQPTKRCRAESIPDHESSFNGTLVPEKHHQKYLDSNNGLRSQPQSSKSAPKMPPFAEQATVYKNPSSSLGLEEGAGPKPKSRAPPQKASDTSTEDEHDWIFQM